MTNLMAQGDDTLDPRSGSVRHISPALTVASATAAVKPKLRGWFHAGTFPLAVDRIGLGEEFDPHAVYCCIQ